MKKKLSSILLANVTVDKNTQKKLLRKQFKHQKFEKRERISF